MNVKFSHKIDAPATLNVEATSVNLTTDGLFLQATDGRKLFKLNITFLHEVIPEESVWSMVNASVGIHRLAVVLSIFRRPLLVA